MKSIRYEVRIRYKYVCDPKSFSFCFAIFHSTRKFVCSKLRRCKSSKRTKRATRIDKCIKYAHTYVHIALGEGWWRSAVSHHTTRRRQWWRHWWWRAASAVVAPCLIYRSTFFPERFLLRFDPLARMYVYVYHDMVGGPLLDASRLLQPYLSEWHVVMRMIRMVAKVICSFDYSYAKTTNAGRLMRLLLFTFIILHPINFCRSPLCKQSIHNEINSEDRLIC